MAPTAENLAPIFSNKLESIRVTEGQTAKFVITVNGHPKPDVKWFVNGYPVKNVSIFNFKFFCRNLY